MHPRAETLRALVRNLLAWLLSAPSPPPLWLHAVLGVIEHNLFTLPIGIIGVIVGLIFPPMFYLCGFCIVLAIHRQKPFGGHSRVFQSSVYIGISIVLFLVLNHCCPN